MIKEIPSEERKKLSDLPWLNSFVNQIGPPSTIRQMRIRDCEASDINTCLNLNTDCVRKNKHAWILPETFNGATPSKWFQKSKKIVDDVWNTNSEATTRTVIDLNLMEILKQDPSLRPFGCWGEVSITFQGGGIQLNGKSDYFLGYGVPGNETLEGMLVGGEAKARGQMFNIWQIIGYCGIIHNIRKSKSKITCTVYGFVTDSSIWEFIRIDNDSVVYTSSPIANNEEILSWLKYILHCAMLSTPTANPYNSESELKEFSIKIEKFWTLQEKDGPEKIGSLEIGGTSP